MVTIAPGLPTTKTSPAFISPNILPYLFSTSKQLLSLRYSPDRRMAKLRQVRIDDPIEIVANVQSTVVSACVFLLKY